MLLQEYEQGSYVVFVVLLQVDTPALESPSHGNSWHAGNNKLLALSAVKVFPARTWTALYDTACSYPCSAGASQ